MMTVLFESPVGITFERIDYKNRSKVRVHNHGYHLRTYRFNNVPEFKSPYISWQNLDCCGGWRYDRRYLETAVQNGTKLFALIVHHKDEVIEGTITTVVATHTHDWLKDHCKTFVSSKGCLHDFYDLDAVVAHYSRLGIKLTEKEIAIVDEWFAIPLWMFGTADAPFSILDISEVEQFVVTGLLLGYPLESTASIIEENCL